MLGRRLGFGDRLLAHGRGSIPDDELEKLATNQNVVSALVEAALGALYLEHGFEAIREPILDTFRERIEYALTSYVDYKTVLQEEAARRGLSVSYSVVEVDGPPHERSFTCAAVVDGEHAGLGKGDSKKAAEQNAAREALAGFSASNA